MDMEVMIESVCRGDWVLAKRQNCRRDQIRHNLIPCIFEVRLIRVEIRGIIKVLKAAISGQIYHRVGKFRIPSKKHVV